MPDSKCQMVRDPWLLVGWTLLPEYPRRRLGSLCPALLGPVRQPMVEPWRLVLRSGQRHVVGLDDGRLEGIGPFGVEVRTLDGQPVVASVLYRFGEAGGLSVRPGVAVAARGWVVDLGERYGATTDVLAVMNPAVEGIATIEVKVLAGTAPASVVRSVELSPGTQVSFDLGAGPPVVLAVESTAPVIASVLARAESSATGSIAVAVAGTEARPAASR